MDKVTDLITDADPLGTSTSTVITPADGLQKRQLYSYGHYSAPNATTTTAQSTVVSITGSTVEATSTASQPFSETAHGVPVSTSPLQSGDVSATTRTITSQTNLTVVPSTQSLQTTDSVTVTVGVNETLTLTPTISTVSSSTNTLTVTSTGLLTETASLQVNSTTIKGASASASGSATESSVSVPISTIHVTVVTEPSVAVPVSTIHVTVVPIPANFNSTVSVAAVTGTPATYSYSSGLNTTLTSTVTISGTTLVTLTTVVGQSTSTCTESEVSTVYR